MYTLHLKNKQDFEITAEEYKNIVSSSEGLITLSRIDVTFNKNMIASIQPKDSTAQYDDWEKRQTMQVGYLHTGERAVRQFGQWYDPEGLVDETGKLQTRYDSLVYPEVARDCLASQKEWVHELKDLSREERLQKMLEKVGGEKLLSGQTKDFEKLEY